MVVAAAFFASHRLTALLSACEPNIMMMSPFVACIQSWLLHHKTAFSFVDDYFFYHTSPPFGREKDSTTIFRPKKERRRSVPSLETSERAGRVKIRTPTDSRPFQERLSEDEDEVLTFLYFVTLELSVPNSARSARRRNEDNNNVNNDNN